jgi:multidrug efflux pump subunit AcrA (membrane-fusion protein)
MNEENKFSTASEMEAPVNAEMASSHEADASTTADPQEELAKLRAALKKANKEAAERRKLLEQYEAERKQKEEAELSELDKLRRQLEQEQKRREEAERRARERLLKAEVQAHATRLNFLDPGDAWRLLDLSDIDYDENGEPLGIAEKLQVLAKEKPYLLRRQPVAETNAREGRGRQDGMTEDKLRQLKQRFGIN